MKVKLIKNAVVNGSVFFAGAVVEASEEEAKALVNAGKAEVVTAAPAVPAKSKSADKGD